MKRQSKAEEALKKQVANIKQTEATLEAEIHDIRAQLSILFDTRMEIEREIFRLETARKQASEVRK